MKQNAKSLSLFLVYSYSACYTRVLDEKMCQIINKLLLTVADS